MPRYAYGVIIQWSTNDPSIHDPSSADARKLAAKRCRAASKSLWPRARSKRPSCAAGDGERHVTIGTMMDHGSATLQTANLWLKITFLAQVYSATFSKITRISVQNMHFGYWNAFWRITSCFYWLKPGVQTRIRMITNMFMAKITFVALPTNNVYLDDIYLDWCAINLYIYIYILVSIYI